ncbi:hypothetical protein [Streptomyces longispororuber]|uniref:hypothetical protein n=1 Tax=Streptomyces longispororuber TaxID=68230 RepID=UPI00210B58C9|nr:hypothetical protein [Streptomyces longispororuber]MCQ4212336.1 hypothetical protein [Streptomyces longispororuber]
MSDGAARRPRLNVAYGSWELIWSHVHRVLVVNLGIAVANLPLLLALQMSHQPWRHPVFFGVLLLVLPGPSLAAAFAYLGATVATGEAAAASGASEEQAPVRVFVTAYRRLFRRAVLVSAPFVLLVVAAVADVVTLRTSALGAAVVPMAVMVALVATVAWPVALAHVAAGGTAGRRLFLLAPYAALRHPLLTLMNLVLAAVALLLVNQAPLMGLAVLPGCVLFVVGRNCQVMADFTDRGVAVDHVGPGAPVAPAAREGGADAASEERSTLAKH